MAYRLVVPTVSPVTVVYRAQDLDMLMADIRLMLEEEETVNLTIEKDAVPEDEVAALPEFNGY